MLRARKFALCAPLPKAKRSKRAWITFDTVDLTADENDAMRVDTIFHIIVLGKCFS